MSPRSADPSVRTALIDAAARLLVAEGPRALTTRAIANAAGASTMAVYTHFSGMDELRGAVAEEGWVRFRRRLELIPESEDPVADLLRLVEAYLENAFANPDLYRLMFGEHGHVDLDTFQRVIDGIARAVEAGRFSGDPRELAIQLWASVHGVISLCLVGSFTEEQAVKISFDLSERLFVGFGDAPGRARQPVPTTS